MSGYLTRLAVRSTRAATGLRPRTPSLFEAATPTAFDHVRPGWRDVSETPPVPTDDPTPAITARLHDGGEPTLAETRPFRARSAPSPEPSTVRDRDEARPASDAGPSIRTIAASLSPLPSDVPTARPAPRLTEYPHDVSPVREEHAPSAHADAATVRTSSLTPDAPPAFGNRLPSTIAERDVDIALPRLHPGPPAPEPAPEVSVSIGRIEIVTPPTPAPPATVVRPARATRPSTAPALADYLRDRSGR